MSIARVKASSLTQGLPKQKTMLAGNSTILPGSYESIATTTLGSAQATISFTSISNVYKHLQIRYISRSSNTGQANIIVTFNSDTASTYKAHYLEGNGSAASAGVFSSGDARAIGYSTGTTQSANVFAVGVIDILDYANTNKNKTTRSLVGYDNNGSGIVDFDSLMYASTSAITRIDLALSGGWNFAQYSSFALYGIR